jgi:hypothetical protein
MIERATFAAFALGMAFVSPAAADVDVDIHIGAPAAHAAPQPTLPPPPPPMLVPAPRLSKVPGSAVYYVPGATFNLFVFGDHYYSFHQGVWFHSSTHNGPWTAVALQRVPGPVLAVPMKYYRIPPGQAKKMGADGPPGHVKGRHGHGPKWDHEDAD